MSLKPPQLHEKQIRFTISLLQSPRLDRRCSSSLAGVCLALLGFGVFSANAASSAQTQQKQKTATRSIDLSLLPPGFDCSTIHQKGIDKQDNLRAGMIMIACGLTEGGSDPDEGYIRQQRILQIDEEPAARAFVHRRLRRRCHPPGQCVSQSDPIGEHGMGRPQQYLGR